jgi:hypothetical protein
MTKTKDDIYVSNGNKKMSLPTFSLPARQTCPGCTTQCAAKCYARKAEIAYPGVLPSRKRNWLATKQSAFVTGMIAIVKRKGKKWFRIHESGDFYSQAYLEKWVEIVAACPEVKFLAFTKSFHLDFSAAQKLKNLSLVWSVWPDTDLSTVPPGPRAYAGDSGPADALECPGNCDTCLVCWSLAKRGIDVHFTIH